MQTIKNLLKIQKIKLSHRSKNGVIFIVDVELALLNADKNHKIIEINQKNHREPNQFFSPMYEKRSKSTKQKHFRS